MSDVAIQVQGLGKRYTIGGERKPYRTLRESITGLFRPRSAAAADRSFWALKDVDFEVNRGEVVGIIGRNGAGKSTLLKVLSRITEPTEGGADINGRVGSLLEVGTGFHPELTGRENVYLNGAILGMRRAEIAKKFDEIVAFAETERFLDTPVKFYSSGMYTRLAFAVAAHLDPEILIVDEVLAVGDAEFQRKCLGKMKDISRTGERAVLFVSHNIAAITSLCDSCVLLAGGRVVLAGDTRTVVQKYVNEGDLLGMSTFDISKNPESPLVIAGCAVLNAAGVVSGAVGVDEPFAIRVDVTCRAPKDEAEVSLRVETAAGQPIFTTNLSDGQPRTYRFTPGLHTFEVPIRERFLAPGNYTVSIGVHRPNVELFDAQENSTAFAIEEVGSGMSQYHGKGYGMVLVDFPWRLPDAARQSAAATG